MAKQFSEISDSLKAFIERQKLFFVATADVDGHVNLSPKGLDSLRVMERNRIVWRNLTGSGNETAAHIRACNRMTLMFCSFEKEPLILRLYGQARTVHPGEADWDALDGLFEANPGARQIFDLRVELVQTSCGFAVPLFDYRGQRETLDKWARNKGRKGIEQYWREKNRVSLDGKPTDQA